MKRIFALVLLVISFICSGCYQKSNDTLSLNKMNIEDIPTQIINDVVLINQNDDYSCATTSLAMIISEYKGLHDNPLDKDIVWNDSGSSRSTIKTLGNDLEGLFRICDKYGVKYEFLQHLTNEEVEYLLSKHIYLVVFISIDEYRTHAFVLTGYDKVRKEYYINNTNGVRITIPYSELDKHWNAMLGRPRILSERGALIVIPENIKTSKKGLRG